MAWTDAAREASIAVRRAHARGRIARSRAGMGRGSITMYHGTNAANARQILKRGFKSSNPASIASAMERRYGLQAGSIVRSPAYQFPVGRRDLGSVHLTSSLRVAREYGVPEQIQDALRSVYARQHPTGTMTKKYMAEENAWMKREGARISPSKVLAVTIPWSTAGRYGFGKRLGLSAYRKAMGSELPYSMTIPTSKVSRSSVRFASTKHYASAPSIGRRVK